MRRIYSYQIQDESLEDTNKAGRWNPCQEITFRDRKGVHTHKLSAGRHDELYIYREGTETYVLSHNFGLGYWGLQVFDGHDEAGDLFIEAHQAEEVLGRDDPAPYNAIRRMREYI